MESMINFLEDREAEKRLMAHGLGQLMVLQSIISAMVPEVVTEKVTNEQVRTTCYALTGEIFELAQELGWKDWKENSEMTKEHIEDIAEELADVLAFFGLLLYLVTQRTGLNFEEVADAYFKKSQKNIERFLGKSGEKGYPGFSEDYLSFVSDYE